MTAIPDTKTQTARWAITGQILLNARGEARRADGVRPGRKASSRRRLHYVVMPSAHESELNEP